MPYVHPEFWKSLVQKIPDGMLDTWIAETESSIPQLNEIASHGDPDSWIYLTIEMKEADLSLYKGEKDRRLALRR